MNSTFKTEDIDQNFKLPTNIPKDDIVFYDARRAPMRLYGLLPPVVGEGFCRVPHDVALATSPGVHALSYFTAGGRVRFSTDSPYVTIKVKMTETHPMHHMATTGSRGFDLYVDTSAGSYFRALLCTDISFSGGEYEAMVEFSEWDGSMRDYTINFPLYDNVDELYIGLAETASVGSGAPYAYDKPIVYYGSSITQGGCASRPGLAYQSIISRQLNVDHINLGFSGNGKAEKAIVDYMATLDPLIFVSDYDHNTTSHPHLDESHRRLYEKIRAAHPDLPYVMISRPDFIHAESLYRRKIIMDHYMEGIAAGDRNLYFIDGESFFAAEYDKGDCTVDGCHPNDRGFALMADRIGSVLRMILKGQRYL